ncbi:MAG: AAA family ATPase [Terriglobales bacterium]
MNAAAPLRVVQAARLTAADPHTLWMIEPLWLRQAVGVIGGAPKTNKTYLALDIALSVASSTACLGAFAVRDPGAVLVYMAEDAEAAVKQRLLDLCRHRQLDLEKLPLYAITASTLRLDLDTDQRRLAHTVAAYRPRLLVLDPLVRLHALNENDAGEISRLLGYLRDLQRAHACSILLVHHTRKNGGSSSQGGHNLRGSGDLHAWVDSSLYLSRRPPHLRLLPEHRSAPSPEPISLALVSAGAEQRDAHLEIIDTVQAADSERHQIEQTLIAELRAAPRSRAQLRQTLSMRNERLGHLLEHLAAQGRIVHADHLWRIPFP